MSGHRRQGTYLMSQRSSLLLAVVVAFASSLIAQADHPQPALADAPQVTFEITWRGADPQWYQIAIDSTGRASYQSQARTEPNETPGDPYMLKFTATNKLRDRIFGLTRDLDYFRKDLKFTGNQRIAYTGDKVFSYTAEGKTTKTDFNYSANPKAQELATIFQQMSACFELGRKLDYSLRYDKLGMEQQLKQLESLQREGNLPGLPVLIPTLERVLSDPATMNISRQRANYLLYAAKSEK